MSEDLIRVIMMALAILLPTGVPLYLMSRRGRGSAESRAAIKQLNVLFAERAAELDRSKRGRKTGA